MTWTILILVIGIALFLFGSAVLKQDVKKPSARVTLGQNAIKVLAIILIAGSVTRLWTPNYLINVNPGILQEMVQNMQDAQQAEANKEVKDYVRKNMDDMVENAPVLGNVDAKKTIFLWTDYSCPYCKRVHNELVKVLDERDDVRVVLKEFSIHGPLSDAPAKAVIAAKLQSVEKSAKLDMLLSTRDYYSQEDMKDQSGLGAKVHNNVMKLAKEAGLDTEKLESDMKGAVVSKEMAQVRDLAQRFQISGTPFLIIGDKAFPGAIPYAQIMDALD